MYLPCPRIQGQSSAESGLDTKPPRRLYEDGFMVVLHDMNPNDHSQILPISHMMVYLISLHLRWCSFGGPFMIRPKSLCKTFKPALSLTIWTTGVKCWQLLRKTDVLCINMFCKLKDSDDYDLWLDVVVMIISFFFFFWSWNWQIFQSGIWKKMDKKCCFRGVILGPKVQVGQIWPFFGLEAEFGHLPPLPHVIVSATRYNV